MDKNVQMQYKDAGGNTHNVFPVSKAEIVRNIALVGKTNEYEDLANIPDSISNEEILEICVQ